MEEIVKLIEKGLVPDRTFLINVLSRGLRSDHECFYSWSSFVATDKILLDLLSWLLLFEDDEDCVYLILLLIDRMLEGSKDWLDESLLQR